MGVCILTDGDNALLYCSTSGWGFGPLFSKDEQGRDAEQMAKRFLNWLPGDPRTYQDHQLEKQYSAFLDWNEKHFTLEDYSELGLDVPDCLKDKAMEEMSEEGIHKDDFPDKEWSFIERILEDGPWAIQAKEKVA